MTNRRNWRWLADEDLAVINAQSDALSNGYSIKGQYGLTDYSNNTKDSQLALGIDKKLNKNSKKFAYYAQVKTDLIETDNDTSPLAFAYELKF